MSGFANGVTGSMRGTGIIGATEINEVTGNIGFTEFGTSEWLLIPMTLLLFIGLITSGALLHQTVSAPKILYPKTLSILRQKMLSDKNGRFIYHRYLIWCSVTGSKATPEAYLAISMVGATGGFLFGLLFSNILVSLSLFLLFFLSPSLILYARYTVLINRMIRSFCTFVDLFARHYSSRKNIVLAFRDMLGDCPKELQAELILLSNTLSDGGNPVKAVEAFADRLNHDWARDFATYIMSGLEGETADIQSSLNRLTNEMYIEQDEREERKSEIYAIWISLVIVIIICLLLIPYNQSLLPDSYRLYFFTADGQALLAMAVTTWCLSILLAFIWGRRHG
ncbi:type II secretion system F family protein [Brevibacillus dissolubilis]|uniref:type II secretion system F family protein n=1 Tax=Brevibacillus dissolubilis TaxID=1844116 RepID=UPI0021003881|nr:type II secretion system F family protein [Brevibacillus dissolubilis]